MNAPSSESRGIECSLLELYEPNEHAPSMSAFDILRDLAKRSVTMQDALSEKVLSRQRLGKRLRQPLEEALRRVALTYSDVHIEDDGHGAWLTLTLTLTSSDNTAKAVFKVHAARGLKVRRVSKKESKVTFNDLGKARPSTSRCDSSGQLSVRVLEEDPNPTSTVTLT